MDPIPKSGFYYPNKAGRIILESLESVMGKNGLIAILRFAHLEPLIDNYPPNNLERHFDFADVTAINCGLEEMYGPRGGRSLALRAGRATFAEVLRNFGALAGVGDLAFKVLPLPTKMKIGIPTMARIFSQISDQHSTVEEKEDHFVYTIHRCPQCWGRKGLDKPVCFMGAGLLQEGLKWISGGNEFRITETQCMAMGDEKCVYIINKQPLS
jgi:predicted hydrocarbon binding protein